MIIIDFLYSIIGTPLGYVMWVCYLIVNNFGWAIIIFTLIVKMAMMPLTLKQQKNMAKAQLFQPRVQEIQTKYRNNKEKQQEELAKLQKEGYNPMGGCGSMLLTFVLLFGVIDVVYKPMTHMEHLDWGDTGAVTQVVTRAKQVDYGTILLANNDDLQVYLDYIDNPTSLQIITQEKLDQLTAEAQANAQLQPQVTLAEGVTLDIDTFKADVEFTKESVMSTYGLTEEQWSKLNNISDDTVNALVAGESRLSAPIKTALTTSKNANFVSLRQELSALRVYSTHKEAFSGLTIKASTLDKLENLSSNMSFAGLDLGETPSFAWPGILVPVLSFIASFAQMIISQIIQKKTNPAMANAGGAAKIMLYIMPFFSLFIAFQVPAGVGLYWTVSYVFGIAQSFAIYKIWPPEKMREEAAAQLKAKKVNVGATATVVDIDEQGNEIKLVRKVDEMSQKELRELQRKKIEEARRADAAKYGDDDIPELPPLESDGDKDE